MHHRSGARGTPSAPAQHPTLLWNGQPFVLALPIFREASVVRTRAVPEARRREFNEHGWPREYILLQEYRLVFIGRHITLVVITNAAEAEEELPENIVTHVRDLGTFRNATLHWRGREDDAIVSARLTSSKDRMRMKAAPLPPRASDGAPAPSPMAAVSLEPTIANMLAAALRVVKSGIVITDAELPRRMTESQRELANFLLARRADDGERPLSLDDIGKILGCSDETVRRRQMRLEKKFPELAAVFRSFRLRNQKGEAVSPLRPHHTPSDNSDPQQPED